jgi:AraC-like DNA-binding protein
VNRLECGCPSLRLAQRRAGGFTVTRSTYAPECTLGTHVHAEDRIVLTLYGEFESMYGSRRFGVDERRAMFRPAHVEHSDKYSTETACISVQLPLENELRAHFFDFADPALPAMARRLGNELDADDPTSSLAIEVEAAELVWRLSSRRERPTGRPAWVRSVRDRLEDEYGTPPCLSDIANGVDRDVSHVATTFRETYGTSIGEYVRNLRLWHARPLLDDASQSVADVAACVGFADQSHFTRRFKQRFGITPARYRTRTHAHRG